MGLWNTLLADDIKDIIYDIRWEHKDRMKQNNEIIVFKKKSIDHIFDKYNTRIKIEDSTVSILEKDTILDNEIDKIQKTIDELQSTINTLRGDQIELFS